MRVLDLFCGAGGAAMGYAQAWPDAEIVGVDIRPQRRYPFHFVQADATTFPLDGFDFIHASPECRDHTTYTNRHGLTGSGWQLDDVIRRLIQQGTPWAVENVATAKHGRPSVILCGSMFGLRVRRHRRFWTSCPVLEPPACQHEGQDVVTVTGHSGGRSRRDGDRGRGTADVWRDAMGLWHTNRDELAQAVPPAYTRWIAENGTWR